MSTFLARAAALAVAPAAIAYPGSVAGLVGMPDGSVHVATQGGSTTAVAQLTALDANGAFGPAAPLLGRPARLRVLAPAVTADGGAVVVYATGRRKSARTFFSSVGPTGTPLVTGAPIVGLRGSGTGYPTVVTGPTGAVAVASQSGFGEAVRPRLAFKPSGASHFAKAVALGASVSAYRAEREQTAIFQLALGPDGGGAVLTTPGGYPAAAPFLRRISPTGVLGPRITVPVGRHAGVQSQLEFGPGGTLVVAGVYYDNKGKGGATVDRVFATSLAPGAAAVGPLQSLGRASDAAYVASAVTLAVGPGDRALVAFGASDHAMTVFEGAPGALQRVGSWPTYAPQDAFSVVAPDGGATVVWSQLGDSEDVPESLQVAHRGPLSTAFDAPQPLLPPDPRAVGFTASTPVALPDGQLALAYTRFGPGELDEGHDFVARFTP
jgi:hypothetical protein